MAGGTVAGTERRSGQSAQRRGPGRDEPRPGPAASEAQKAYFDTLHAEAMRCYAIAKQARRKGKDPSLEVEVPPAEDLAARVEAQVGPEGVAQRIRTATKELGNRELVSLRVAMEVSKELHAEGTGREACLDQAVRTGLSILTEGVLVAPLEGIAEVRIGANMDGTDYVDLYFAGPIRAAGGTGQAMSVLIADVVRRELEVGTYVPTEAEVERYKEEIPAYKQAANLQYTPTGDEIDLIARNCPVCINGEGTEQEEITGNRDLPRVESNRLRGGACLVMAEGLVLKAPKILKHVENLGLEGWGFLDGFIKKSSRDDGDGDDGDGIPEIHPNDKFVRDIIAGRPVFSHPSRPGGFRLRYGRARTGGLASNALHPASMAVVDDFLAVGTQLKVERPGKGTLATPCDTVEGPTVLLRTGDLVRLHSVDEVREYRPAIEEIVDLGELLVPFGEFAENNAHLPHASWCWEWWVQEHQAATGETEDVHPSGSLTGRQMVDLADATGIPLHPDGTLLWHDVSALQMRTLSDRIAQDGAWEDDGLWLPEDPAVKEPLMALLCLHTVQDGRLRIEERLAIPLLRCLGLDLDAGTVTTTERRRILHDPCQPDFTTPYPTVELAQRLAGFPVRPRAPARIGGRMGRPEKADVRKMQPPPHGLFPLGQAGGNQRLVRDAADKVGTIEVEVGERACTSCNAKTWRIECDRCGAHTDPVPRPPDRNGRGDPELRSINLRAELERARKALEMGRLPRSVKGVIGVINKDKTPEPLEKCLLRAKHELWTFKDGTVRFDMTDVPLTHFRPDEVHASPERLRELGYTHDRHGAPLEREDQVLELRVQDIVVSKGCMEYFLRTTRYLDELLQKFYGLDPYYGADSIDDLIGALTIGLAPHTSGGVLSRIVGWTTAQGHYGHPYFHAAKRRNCLPGDAEVTVLNSPAPVRSTLQALYEGASGPQQVVDDTGTMAREAEGFRVLAADPATGAIAPRSVRRVYKVPAPDHLVALRLQSGRRLVVSPHHRVEVHDGALVKRRALDVHPGDRLAFATRIPGADVPLPSLDLWQELVGDPLPGVMVRGAQEWLAEGVAGQGLAALAAAAGVPRKSLDQYRRRDSIPEPVARSLEPLLGPIPEAVRLAVVRDTVAIPRVVERDGPFGRLVGWYIAEGSARSGAVNQVDIAASDHAVQQDIADAVHHVFGLRVRPQRTRVTLSGRLLHHLFTRILRLGENAHAKCIPTWAAAAPTSLRRELLSACFAGDGSVEAGRLHVAYHTVSRPLLRDLQTQLATFGIASRIRQEDRVAGGAVAAHARRTGRSVPERRSWSLHIHSEDAVRFAQEVGFALPRKQEALLQVTGKARKSRLVRFGDLALDPVAAVEHVSCRDEWLYDLEVEDHHNFLVEDLVLASNCDGDEDAVLLLMDGLLNFSRKMVPDRRGGLMDLPLVLTTRLDPNEVDKEAHNVDTLSRYPLAFFEATTRHAHAKEVAAIMGLVDGRVGTPGQYEGFGFTHDTRDIAEGPARSAYKVLETMMEKMTAQMELARRIRAVDEADVGAKVIGTHFLPDLMGNLKAFSKQKVRCPQCNAKYRRMPLKGVCLACGNPKLTLTVHEGSVRKYLNISKEVAEKYNIDAYTKQRILLLESAVESLFNNDKVHKSKLSEFL